MFEGVHAAGYGDFVEPDAFFSDLFKVFPPGAGCCDLESLILQEVYQGEEKVFYREIHGAQLKDAQRHRLLITFPGKLPVKGS